jgi:hypothetical protein
MRFPARQLAFLLLMFAALSAQADPLARPGDMLLRHDIRLLVDEGVLNLPMNTWPIPWGDIVDQLNRASAKPSSPEIAAAMTRLRDRARWELDPREWYVTGWASVAAEPRVIRTFEDTPREEAEAGLAFSWTGNRFTLNLSAAYANDPDDGEEFRPDDTYLGMALGNWMLAAALVGARQRRELDSLEQRATEARDHSAEKPEHAVRDQVAQLAGPMEPDDVHGVPRRRTCNKRSFVVGFPLRIPSALRPRDQCDALSDVVR